MERVLRIPRSDQRDDFILTHIDIVNSGRGFAATLIATEGESPYITKGKLILNYLTLNLADHLPLVKESNLSQLRAKNYQGSDEEWAQIIAYVLGQEESSTKPPSCNGVEISASITGDDGDDQELVITIRKRIESITVNMPMSTSTARSRLTNLTFLL